MFRHHQKRAARLLYPISYPKIVTFDRIQAVMAKESAEERMACQYPRRRGEPSVHIMADICGSLWLSKLSDTIDHSVDSLVELNIGITEEDQIAMCLVEEPIDGPGEANVIFGIIMEEDFDRLIDLADTLVQRQHVCLRVEAYRDYCDHFFFLISLASSTTIVIQSTPTNPMRISSHRLTSSVHPSP